MYGRERERKRNLVYADELENGIKHSCNWKVFFLFLPPESGFNKDASCSIYQLRLRRWSIQQLVVWGSHTHINPLLELLSVFCLHLLLQMVLLEWWRMYWKWNKKNIPNWCFCKIKWISSCSEIKKDQTAFVDYWLVWFR